MVDPVEVVTSYLPSYLNYLYHLSTICFINIKKIRRKKSLHVAGTQGSIHSGYMCSIYSGTCVLCIPDTCSMHSGIQGSIYSGIWGSMYSGTWVLCILVHGFYVFWYMGSMYSGI